MLFTFSKTSTEVALPCAKLPSEVFLSLSEDGDSTLFERLFLSFPMMNTVLGAKISEFQRNWVNEFGDILQKENL